MKYAPYNISQGKMQGALDYDKRTLNFKVGGTRYEETPTILQFYDTPIIKCRLDEGQAKVSLVILDETFHQVLVIEDNVIRFRVDDLWDFEYGHRHAVARRGKGDVILRMDFRGDEAIIEGRIFLGCDRVDLSPDRMTMPRGMQVAGGHVRQCAVGIQIGDPEVALPVRCRLS
ncbi:hypothetical protein AAG611_13620 [Citromicrobium bathyomarinum]